MFKSLQNFIQESLILEGAFTGGDWVGIHVKDWHYPKQVIHDLLTGKPVKLQSGGELTLDDFDKTKLADLASKLEKTPELTSKLDFADAYIGGQISKKKNPWHAIDKMPYSNSISNSLGENAESLVCYLFNNGITGENIEKWSNQSKIKLDDLYIKSCKEIVKLLQSKWNSSDYEAVHVDGKDYDTDLNNYSKYIAMIFKSKKSGAKVLGFNINDLYSSSKDKWNPADIILIYKPNLEKTWLRLQEIAKDGVQGSYGEPLNVVLSKLCYEEEVIPISLKKCIKEPRIFSHCAYNEEAADITNVETLSIASRYVKDKANGSIYIIALTGENDTCTIQFRTQDRNDNNLSIESYLQSKSARGGKGLTVVKSALGIKRGQAYYAKVNSNEELKDEFQKMGFEIKLSKNIDKITPPLYKRTCCIGLLGLLQKYKKFVESLGDTYTPVKASEFFWAACCTCPGSYHVVHD